ncbi:hypothetical protein A7L55_18225 [Acinetobacter baumannii]|nr:hypothetical protein A7L55_18225 [Acinetobacter baumannii]
MYRVFAIISLHFGDFKIRDWVSWFTVKLTPLLPSLTAEMLQTAASDADCDAYHVMYVALRNAGLTAVPLKSRGEGGAGVMF